MKIELNSTIYSNLTELNLKIYSLILSEFDQKTTPDYDTKRVKHKFFHLKFRQFKNHRHINGTFVISMVDLVGIDVHIVHIVKF